jgi:hypothetical protein
METVCPALSFIGNEGPLALKAAVDEATPESVIVSRLLFVTVNDWEVLLPTCMLPKLKVAGVAVTGL